jgi:hypothetical protein
MALIYCPECSTVVSDKAAVCVKCGYPICKPMASVIIFLPKAETYFADTHAFCYRIKSDGKKVLLSKADQGGSLSFQCNEPINIEIIMKSIDKKPVIAEVLPEGRYRLERLLNSGLFGPTLLDKLSQWLGEPCLRLVKIG